MPMPARTELDRLAAARPALLDRTDLVIDPAAEDQIVRHILGTPRASGRRRLANASHHALRPVTAIAAATVMVIAAAGVLVRSAVDHSDAPGRRTVERPSAALAHLPSVRIIAARTAAAVAAASRTGILDVRTVYAPGTTVGGVAVMETWTRGNSDREKLLGADGGLLDDVSAIIAGGQRVRRFVDYPTRTWQTDSIAVGQYGGAPSASEIVARILGPIRPVRLSQVPGGHRPDDPRRTVTAVTVAGKPMILVTFRYPRPISGPAELVPMLGDAEEIPGSAANADSAGIAMTWIDATSYLPVRTEVATTTGRFLDSQTFSWLSDDTANRVVLSAAPVPVGFRRTAELGH